jgi:FtsZ-interacting cell division protein YlmF
MGKFSDFRNKVDTLNNEPYDQEDDTPENTTKDTRPPDPKVDFPKARDTTVLPFSHAPQANTPTSIVLVVPTNEEERVKFADYLKSGKTIIINFELLKTASARTIYYFMCGVACSMNASVEKISSNIFIFLPEDTKLIRGDEPKKPSGGTKNPTWKL